MPNQLGVLCDITNFGLRPSRVIREWPLIASRWPWFSSLINKTLKLVFFTENNFFISNDSHFGPIQLGDSSYDPFNIMQQVKCLGTQDLY